MSITFYDKQEALDYKKSKEDEGYSVILTKIDDGYKVNLTGKVQPKKTEELFNESFSESHPIEEPRKKYGVTEVRLTEKGYNFLDKRLKGNPKSETLITIEYGSMDAANQPEYGSGHSVSELLAEGLVEPISFKKILDEAKFSIGKIDSKMGMVLETYVKIAREEHVDEDSLNKSLQYLKTIDEVSFKFDTKDILTSNLLEQDYTAKVIALDSAMQELHDVIGSKGARYPETNEWNKLYKVLSILNEGNVEDLS